MSSSARLAGGTAALMMLSAPSVVEARPSAPHVIRVPCGGPALSAAVAAADRAPATLRLAPWCTYQIATTLTVGGRVSLIGGPSTSITPLPGVIGRLLDVIAGGDLRVREIFVLGGTGNGGDEGIGIQNAGNLDLRNVTISGNTSNNGNGAGLANLATGRATISYSVVSANISNGDSGPGTGGGGAIINRGILTFLRSRLSANVNAGGISTDPSGTTNIIRSTIDHNVTTRSGGGVFNAGFTSLDHTLVERNAAAVDGGGVYQDAGTISKSFTIVRANTPNNCGPGNTIPQCEG